ncbi:MAG: phage head-tail connector protein [Carnobacterium sp.]|uniref:phage head-tail connector protein n=1 Tax=Carnobacterium sp. TaxID=48221 RepID=UPI003C7406A1
MTTLELIKLILGIEDNSKDSVLLAIINIQTEAVKTEIGVKELPKQLEYIVTETAIARYNRIGSEGLKSENIDVIGQNFLTDLLEPYAKTLKSFKKANAKVRMI